MRMQLHYTFQHIDACIKAALFEASLLVNSGPRESSMNPALRQAWTELVTAADLNDHMHEVGQAEANAFIS